MHRQSHGPLLWCALKLLLGNVISENANYLYLNKIKKTSSTKAKIANARVRLMCLSK